MRVLPGSPLSGMSMTDIITRRRQEAEEMQATGALPDFAPRGSTPMATEEFGVMPTMIQQFYNPKSSRGSRLGRGTDLASTMVQFGYGQPGTNINVSPTFSNIGSPEIAVGGMSVGDIALGEGIRQTGGGTTGGGGTTPTRPGGGGTTPTRPGGGGTTPTRPGGGGRTGGGGGGGGGGGENTLDINRELRQAEKTGQSKNPRITKSELKDIFKSGDAGPRGLRNLVEDSGLKLGGKAQDFLNRQLDKVGAGGGRLGGGGGGGGGGNRQQPQGVIGLINKAGVPGTTNLKGTIPTGGSNQSIVQRAAAQGGRDDKLGKGEVKDLLKTGDVSSKNILNQIQKGNIEASKKAIAKAKAAAKSNKK